MMKSGPSNKVIKRGDKNWAQFENDVTSTSKIGAIIFF